MLQKNTQKRFAPKLKIKTGDRVVVIAGSDKGKEGEVLQVFPTENKAIVSDVRIVKRHTKPTNSQPGGIVELNAKIDISNLMLLAGKKGEATRVGRRIEEGKIVRYSKKSGETI